ncbi:hypothetical protein BO71DRAFT_486851 [Aspergillus ellipticus CBS 707.79]|uniref:Serine hydrolase domain-containing protein n=1 Tax=Aspergillus ellipticus CBS 707.79 TaxID=1448320 RepID=A0A319CZJ5_9EURO|nr:hypothetical protein BO71DRAFT_486851 [Aspergillus ellipticus CBS 707.79]
MRFLCLHGSGTSAELFDLQAGGITQALEEEGHEFVFIDGKIEAEPTADFKGSFDGPFYDHYNRGPQPPNGSLAKAFTHTLDIINEQGPFDAVMGFSQGAALAAALIVHWKKTHPQSLFSLAVFICGVRPFESDGMKPIERDSVGAYPIDIPTVHIFGKKDAVYLDGMGLYGLCDPEKTVLYEHGMGHTIPFGEEETEAMIRAMQDGMKKCGV